MFPRSLCYLGFAIFLAACSTESTRGAADGAATGAVVGAVGGMVTALVFGGDVGDAAARGAVWGGSTGAVAGGMRGAEQARRNEAAAQQNRPPPLTSCAAISATMPSAAWRPSPSAATRSPSPTPRAPSNRPNRTSSSRVTGSRSWPWPRTPVKTPPWQCCRTWSPAIPSSPRQARPGHWSVKPWMTSNRFAPTTGCPKRVVSRTATMRRS